MPTMALRAHYDGKHIVLDEDEFNELTLNDLEREQAVKALSELQLLFRKQ